MESGATHNLCDWQVSIHRPGKGTVSYHKTISYKWYLRVSEKVVSCGLNAKQYEKTAPE